MKNNKIILQKFIKSMLDMCTVQFQLDLSCNLVG
jgi:hypothetical protein